ncbi:hypothetical protein [Phormidesmis sp. 146-33]
MTRSGFQTCLFWKGLTTRRGSQNSLTPFHRGTKPIWTGFTTRSLVKSLSIVKQGRFDASVTVLRLWCAIVVRAIAFLLEIRNYASQIRVGHSQTVFC